MKTTLSQLAAWVTGAQATGDVEIDGVSTDSRNIQTGQLFVALRGERFDAHDFLQAVAESGAAAVVVEQLPEGWDLPALVVPDTRVALGEMARHWRMQFSVPLIAVTGSNGKTTVKEMIAAILNEAYGADRYLATRGNLNNEIGVPLTLFQLSDQHSAAVVELGMNHVGEIALLASMAQPSIALVNNAQREHQEFMQSVEAVARENGAVIEALPDDGVAVFPSDDPYTAIWRDLAMAKGGRRIISFGMSSNADITCTYRPDEFGSVMSLDIKGRKLSVRLAAAGLHNVRNAMAAAACCRAVGIDAETIARGLAAFLPVSGRMQQKIASCGATIVDDTYNANPDSVLAAIAVLAETPSPRILVLGDMGEVGSEGRRFHEEVGAKTRASGIEHLLVLGDLAAHAATAFGADARHFNDWEELAASLEDLLSSDTTVLVKGSRFMQMERVVHRLINEPIEKAH